MSGGSPRITARDARESGQAAIETALTLPLTMFLILGTIQLGLLLNGRLMAHYAAFRAARAGSVNQGDCSRMTEAAIAALLPSFISYMSSATPGQTPSERYANAFALRRKNRYDARGDSGYTEPIVWILRDRPTIAQVNAVAQNGEDVDFDQFQGDSLRMEVRLIYWFPMKIPFANWVMYQMYRTHFGLGSYTAQNPLMPTQKAAWTGSATLRSELATELTTRGSAGHYAFPIQASYTMRMLTPAKQKFFATQHCQPAPPIAVP